MLILKIIGAVVLWAALTLLLAKVCGFNQTGHD